ASSGVSRAPCWISSVRGTSLAPGAGGAGGGPLAPHGGVGGGPPPLAPGAGPSPEQENSRIRRLEKLIKKRL
ncbi:unnamed protein product, partial [Lampetra fluviatilis]